MTQEMVIKSGTLELKRRVDEVRIMNIEVSVLGAVQQQVLDAGLCCVRACVWMQRCVCILMHKK